MSAAAAAAVGHDEIPVGGLRRECRSDRRLALPPRMHHGFWSQLQCILLHIRNGNYRIVQANRSDLHSKRNFKVTTGLLDQSKQYARIRRKSAPTT